MLLCNDALDAMYNKRLSITTDYLSGIAKQASSSNVVAPTDYYMIKAATYEAGMTKSAGFIINGLRFLASKVAPGVMRWAGRGLSRLGPKFKSVFRHPGRALWRGAKTIGGAIFPYVAFEGLSHLFGGGSDEEHEDYEEQQDPFNYRPNNGGYNNGGYNNGYNYRPESTSPVLWDRIKDPQTSTGYPAYSQPTGSPAASQNQNPVINYQDWRNTRANQIAVERWQSQRYLDYLNGLSPQQQVQSQSAIAQNQPKPQTQATVAKPMTTSSVAASTRPSGNAFGLDMNDPFSYYNPYSEPIKPNMDLRYNLGALASQNSN